MEYVGANLAETLVAMEGQERRSEMLDSESESGISFEAGEEVYGGQGGN